MALFPHHRHQPYHKYDDLEEFVSKQFVDFIVTEELHGSDTRVKERRARKLASLWVDAIIARYGYFNHEDISIIDLKIHTEIQANIPDLIALAYLSKVEKSIQTYLDIELQKSNIRAARKQDENAEIVSKVVAAIFPAPPEYPYPKKFQWHHYVIMAFLVVIVAACVRWHYRHWVPNEPLWWFVKWFLGIGTAVTLGKNYYKWAIWFWRKLGRKTVPPQAPTNLRIVSQS